MAAEKHLEASIEGISQDWEDVDVPDGPNRALEKRPRHDRTHLGLGLLLTWGNERQADRRNVGQAVMGLPPLTDCSPPERSSASAAKRPRARVEASRTPSPGDRSGLDPDNALYLHACDSWTRTLSFQRKHIS